MELRLYRYRLYPSRKQKTKLINSLKICKQIYNELLALNIDTYKFNKTTLNKFDFNSYLSGKYNTIYSQSKQNVSDRVHKAFQNFFRRVKDKSYKEKGYPRFKSKVNSITYPQNGFSLVSNKLLKLSKIGNISIILHRIPKGKIKTLTIKQNKIGHWFATFACDLSNIKITHVSNDKIGIDVGLENFATFSNGKIVANPRHIIKAEKKLKLLQRRLSKKKKESINSKKARLMLAKQHLKIVNQRTDFLHKLSYNITKSYSFIAVEKLNIKNMLKTHHLAKSITDASWNQFMQLLTYKAVKCGGQIVEVNPRNTSKMCSKCKTIIELPLNKREFVCTNCGFTCHRDLNAATNILKVGMDYAKLNACGHNVRPFLMAIMDESRTIHNNS
jgi:putative transposase